MSWLSDFLNPEKGYEQAQEKVQQGYDQAVGFLQPYTNTGQNVYNQYLSPAMGQLMNPQQLESDWVSGYQESPYAQQAQEMAKQSGLDALSATGLLGSTPGFNALQTGITNIGLADRQQYLNDLMQKYMQGVGLGQNIYGVGASAAGQGAQAAMNYGDIQGGLEAAKHQASGNMFGNILGGVGNAIGSTVGGPIGGYIGGKVGGALGVSQNPMGTWSLAGGS